MQWSATYFYTNLVLQKSHANHAHRAAASFCAPYREYKFCIALSGLATRVRTYAADVSKDAKTLESELDSVTRLDSCETYINTWHVVACEYK